MVIVAVGMWESPERFPRAVGWVEKQFYRFSMHSTDVISTAFFQAVDFHAATVVVASCQSCSNLIGLT